MAITIDGKEIKRIDMGLRGSIYRVDLGPEGEEVPIWAFPGELILLGGADLSGLVKRTYSCDPSTTAYLGKEAEYLEFTLGNVSGSEYSFQNKSEVFYGDKIKFKDTLDATDKWHIKKALRGKEYTLDKNIDKNIFDATSGNYKYTFKMSGFEGNGDADDYVYFFGVPDGTLVKASASSKGQTQAGGGVAYTVTVKCELKSVSPDKEILAGGYARVDVRPWKSDTWQTGEIYSYSGDGIPTEISTSISNLSMLPSKVEYRLLVSNFEDLADFKNEYFEISNDELSLK
jgi:hypothetical protein